MLTKLKLKIALNLKIYQSQFSNQPNFNVFELKFPTYENRVFKKFKIF